MQKKKYTKFLSTWGSAPRAPCLRRWGALLSNVQSSTNGYVSPDLRNPLPPFYISGCASESNHVFALLISIPCFESINFYQNRLKIMFFLQNNTNFSSAGGSALDPPNASFPISDFWLRVRQGYLVRYEAYAAHTSKF